MSQIHLTPELLFGIIGAVLALLAGVAGYLYTQLVKKIDGFQCFAQTCQDSLVRRFADKEDTNSALNRIILRQDSLRETLPKDYITRAEIASILSAIDVSIVAMREDIKILLQRK